MLPSCLFLKNLDNVDSDMEVIILEKLEKTIRDSNRNEILFSFIGGKSVNLISKNLNFKTKEVESVIRSFLVSKLNMERL